MSTNQGFAPVAAPPKPYLICSGKVTNISEAKLTAGATVEEPEKIQWVRQSFRVEGIGASESAFYSFMYRPEWFAPGFAQDQIGGTPKQVKAQQFIYRRNILNKDAAAFLLATVGFNQDQYVELAEALRTIDTGLDEEGNPTQDYYNAVTDVLNQFCLGNEFGYTLKQASEKQGVDENGKAVYAKKDAYDFDEFFELTEKNVASKQKRAEKAEPGTVKFLIEGEGAF